LKIKQLIIDLIGIMRINEMFNYLKELLNSYRVLVSLLGTHIWDRKAIVQSVRREAYRD
jgi:hypothetical protein